MGIEYFPGPGFLGFRCRAGAGSIAKLRLRQRVGDDRGAVGGRFRVGTLRSGADLPRPHGRLCVDIRSAVTEVS